MVRDELNRLVGSAWDLFRTTEDAGHGVVVRPSIPILFFGDSQAYSRSPLRVLTVGLNPSKMEFDGADPFHRFPSARDVMSRGSRDSYIASLNAYFEADPYRSWFNCYEPLLNGLGTSYYAGRAFSVALHTDICSPVATDPTWNGLGRLVQHGLWEQGRRLWHELVVALEPDIIVASVRKQYADGIRFMGGEPRIAYTLDRTNPYVVTARDMQVSSGKRTLLITGKAAQKPFGTVADTAKYAIGETIRRTLDA